MKHLLLSSVLLVASVSLSAADPAADTFAQTHPRVHEVNSRLRHQDARINKAELEGKLTAAQATTLHNEDANVKSSEKTDRSLDDGHLTKAEQHALNQNLNTISRGIGPDDHPRIHEVDARLSNQDARIARGVADGAISPTKATKLTAEDAKIAAEEKTDESLDDGSLTKVAKHALNQLLNVVSRQISGDTHPREQEVGQRLDKQDARIDRDLAEGKITDAQATTFHNDDTAIASTEKSDESLDDGHITRTEQKSLNQNVSEVGHDIGVAAKASGSTTSAHANGGPSSGHGGGSHK